MLKNMIMLNYVIKNLGRDTCRARAFLETALASSAHVSSIGLHLCMSRLSILLLSSSREAV